jgi:hypothetical protein
MALSLAYEGDLRFDRRDLQRFWSVYGHGPEGIFLKRGAPFRPRLRSAFPFLVFERAPARTMERLYFGKAFLYALCAAPFAVVAGVNGLYLFNVALLAGVLMVGYAFLAARGESTPALLFVTAFFIASCAIVYSAWLTPEILNVALVFFAYFVWLYKEVAPPRTSRWTAWLWTERTDLIAAALLGLATYSKPPNGLLIVPLVLWLWWRRRFWRGGFVGACFVAFLVGGFAFTGVVTGDPNYQGGERKTFYGSFPFENRQATFDSTGSPMATDELTDEESFERAIFWPRLFANTQYFFVGRHFGFVPYCFPGIVALMLFLAHRRERLTWQIFIVLAVAATALWFVINLPFSWSGGGGPVGNRYFLSIYAALFFCVPPLRTWVAPAIAWLGGAAFIGHIVVQPLSAAKHSWVTSQRGLLRLLPVELTMADDLPVRLRLDRARLNYGDPPMLLYLIDEHAFQPEPHGIWVAGEARADLLVRNLTEGHVRLQFESPIANRVTVSAGRGSASVDLQPGVPAGVTIPAKWVQARLGSTACLLSVRTDAGFVPRLSSADSRDSRFLGVLVNFNVVPSGTTGPAGP